MNNILETSLILTHAPVSISEFNRIKKATVLGEGLWSEKEELDKASLYSIGKRKVPVMVPRRDLSDASCIVLDCEIGNVSIRISISASKGSQYSLYGFAGIQNRC